MSKRFVVLIFLVCTFISLGAVADVPEPFRGFDANSKYKIDYTDLESLFEMVVLDTGRSTREKASDAQAKTGTRMKAKVNRYTINEGNRFYYQLFKDNEANQQTLLQIQERLESIPLAVPLEKFSRDEQLAYWLNLYNITVLVEVAKVYPERDLSDLLVGKRSILSKKLLDVAGVPLSLDDIQFTILKQNYDSDPLIMYGLYQGNIGGPSIRKHVYTGKYVYGDLIDNAMEFINSNRGTVSRNESVFRVSTLYERNKVYFADFDKDLSAHLMTYLEGKQRGELQTATTIEADIYDWTVTDIFGSQRDPAGSISNNSAALMGFARGSSSANAVPGAATGARYSPAVLERLNELNRKQEQSRTGNVTIEELGQVTNETADNSKKETG